MGPSSVPAESAKSHFPARLLQCFIEQKQTHVSEESCTRTQMYACVSQMQPSHAVQRLISAEASLTRKHDTQTHTGAASQTTVSLLTGPESAGMYLQTFPLGLKCSFDYFISLDRGRGKHTHQSKHTLMVVLVPFEVVASPKFSRDGSQGELAKTKSPQSKIPSAEQQKHNIRQTNTGYSIRRYAC